MTPCEKLALHYVLDSEFPDVRFRTRNCRDSGVELRWSGEPQPHVVVGVLWDQELYGFDKVASLRWEMGAQTSLSL